MCGCVGCRESCFKIGVTRQASANRFPNWERFVSFSSQAVEKCLYSHCLNRNLISHVSSRIIRSRCQYFCRFYPNRAITYYHCWIHRFFHFAWEESKLSSGIHAHQAYLQSKPEQGSAQSSKDSVEQLSNNQQKIVHHRNERCNQSAQRCDQWAKEG